MTKPNDPVHSLKYKEYREARPDIEHIYMGLTKREHFAAMAMQGILVAKFGQMVANVPESCRYELLGKDALLCADALLAELSK